MNKENSLPNHDRFKYRVWDKIEKRYIPRSLLQQDGFLSSWYDIDHNRYIIEQCTGLRDKNGKLIYEGDVIAFDFGDSEKCYVAWNEAKNFLDMYYLDELPKKVVSHFGLALHKSLSIIGNIHTMSDPPVPSDLSEEESK